MKWRISPRRKRVEQGEPFHGMDRCGSEREGVEETQMVVIERAFGRKACTSYLKRAKTQTWSWMRWISLDPVENVASQREACSILQGLNKAETAEKYGDEQVLIWRRSYDVPPTPLAKDDPRSPSWILATRCGRKGSATYERWFIL